MVDRRVRMVGIFSRWEVEEKAEAPGAETNVTAHNDRASFHRGIKCNGFPMPSMALGRRPKLDSRLFHGFSVGP
jgi:hypothetical protein